MLTLQNILDSDSISTLVAKLNVNFQTLSQSNGGPQGVRGEQGIPGLPGKQGPIGPTGPIGPMGATAGIIPFSTLVQANDALAPGGLSSILQPANSYDFLTTYAGGTWSPSATPQSGELWFDNNQLGWWKYLTVPDPSLLDPESTDVVPTYDTIGTTFNGPGWYFYPLNLSSIISATQGVWSADKTNYLGLVSSQYSSPATITNALTQAPFGIPNARMNSKFGTVWISSGDDTTLTGDNTYNTTNEMYYWDYLNNTRLNSGIDRTLFKMSVDGVPYYDMMKARGFRDTDYAGGGSLAIIGVPYDVNGGSNPIPLSGPSATTAGANPTFFVQPLYPLTIDAYTPVLFLTNRNEYADDTANTGSLGYYQYSPGIGEPGGIGVVRIHNFSTRNANEFWQDDTLISSTNVGEVVWDARKLITTNQFLNLVPQDTAGFRSVNLSTAPSQVNQWNSTPFTKIYEWDSAHTQAYKVFQGYHSVINEHITVENADEGNQTQYGGWGQFLYSNKQSWYGTTIYDHLPAPKDDIVINELIRMSGTMIRGKNNVWPATGAGADWNSKAEGLTFFTTNFTYNTSTYAGPGFGYDPDPLVATVLDNAALSLPVAYMSPTRNMGVGTVANDKDGIFEPIARLHSHGDWRPYEESFDSIVNFYESALTQGSYNGTPKTWFSYDTKAPHYRIKSGAFTVDRTSPASIYNEDEGGAFSETRFGQPADSFPRYGYGVFNDIVIGALDSPFQELDTNIPVNVVKPSSAIRYESFNYLTGVNTSNLVDRGNPLRSGGWGFRGALRLGTSPVWDNGSSVTTDSREIGGNPNLQNVEFPFTLSPLSFGNGLNDTARAGLPVWKAADQAISGVGIHNIYPRARFHAYGKNLYPEFKGEEPYTPGTVEAGVSGTGALTRSTWAAAPSDKQITMDKIEDTYTYAAALYDYSYDYTVNPSGPTFTQWSPNAANYPVNENKSNGTTRSTFNSTLNVSTLSASAPFLQGTGSVHGGSQNGRWSINKYVGFNIFRDLLDKGDYRGEQATFGAYVNLTQALDQYASTWRLGTESTSKDGVDIHNGGSAILSDTEGKLGFAFIKSGRDGGTNYGRWEQVGIGTREIVNNIKIVFDENGNIGIGNAPGYDANAYPSQQYNSVGQLLYLANANGAPMPTPSSSLYQTLAIGVPWTPTRSDRFGLSNTGPYSISGFTNAAINSVTTSPETIRFEVAGEKAQGRPGHHPEKRGYGYPGWLMSVTGTPTGSGGIITITDNASATFARRYLGVTGAAATPWNNAIWSMYFDNVGRIISLQIEGQNGYLPYPLGTNLLTQPDFENALLPHPAEFGENGPFSPSVPLGSFPWTSGITVTININGTLLTNTNKIWIPTSAVAAELGTLNYAEGEPVIIESTFKYEALQPSVVRLNNFVLGDGYEFIRSNGESIDTNVVPGSFIDITTDTTKAIFAQRTSSPKLLMTFGAIDYDSMVSAGFPLGGTKQLALIDAGMAPLMKVTTVIDSAQTDSSLRTYTIPKGANTGGSFMVITDHMGQTEKAAPGLVALPQNNSVPAKKRIYLDKVVAHEVVRTGPIMPNQNDEVGFALADSDEGWYVWPTGYEMLPIHYVKDYGVGNNLICEQVLVDPAEPANRKLGANIRRNLDTYWAVDNTTFTSELQTRAGVTETFEKSEIRYRRLNENYVMFDFNIDLEALMYNSFTVDTVAPYVQPALATLNNIVGDIIPGAAINLNGYTHSPYSPGHLVDEIRFDGNDSTISINYNLWVGVDARWVQYARFIYDAQLDTISSTGDDSYFWENQYGGGPTFGNWNEYRAWNSGTATVGPKITSALQTALMTPNYRNAQGVSNHSWNASDGDQNHQFDVTAPFTGYGWSQPTDGSPYSPWSLALDATTAGDTIGTARYWNGRLNDWFYGRWDQTNSVNTYTGINYVSQGSLYDGKIGDKYSDTYPYDFGWPGYPAGAWENNETTIGVGTTIVWPPPYYPATTLGHANQNYINQYAYKTLWKWVMQLPSPPSPIVNPIVSDSYIYVEHTKMFDNIVNRTFSDDAWNRNGNMQWKVTPVADGNAAYSSNAGAGVTNSTESSTNTSFAIEVMFDKPIFVSGRTLTMPSSSAELANGSLEGIVNNTNAAEHWNHIRTQLRFAGINFDTTTNDLSYDQGVKLYSNLTLRGQSVVKYKQTKRYKTTTIPVE